MNIRYKYASTTSADINVIPLLDVVFSILAFFILLSGGLVVPQRVGIDVLPRTEDTAGNSIGQDVRQMLIVTVDAAGQLKIDGQALSESELKRRIAVYLANYPQNFVVLNAEDASVSYQQAIDKLAVLRQMAGDRVAIATSRS